jgi:hypothetical protein
MIDIKPQWLVGYPYEHGRIKLLINAVTGLRDMFG